MATVERIEAPVTVKAYLMCTFAAFAGILFGYDTGYISSVLGMEVFKRHYGHRVDVSDENPGGYSYDTWQKSLIVSILAAGTFFGALGSGYFADKIGRRSTIIGPGCGTFIVGVTIQVAVANIAGIVVGRFVAGLGVGVVSAINILYMSEIAPRKVRGAMVSGYQFAITIGIMLASCVGYANERSTNSGAYRIPIAIQYLWAIILATGLFFLPESPRYWVKNNRLDKAANALARVRGQDPSSTYIEDELAEIVANCDYERQMGEVSWLGCFSGGITNSNSNARKVFIGTALQMMQQWTGINFIFYYNVTFFKDIGIKDNFLIGMVTTIVNVAGTPFAFYAIEKFGRRALLIWGALAMCLCEFTIAIVGISASNTSDVANKILIAFVCVYVFIFAATWGPTAWVVIGEIFQLPIRSKAVALSTASNWFWNCIIGVITPFMVDQGEGKDGLGVKVFFVWGSTCLFCALFAWIFVPETKGLTLEQVNDMMEESPAYMSKKWKPRATFGEDLTAYGRRSAPSTMEGAQPKIESFIEMGR